MKAEGRLPLDSTYKVVKRPHGDLGPRRRFFQKTKIGRLAKAIFVFIAEDLSGLKDMDLARRIQGNRGKFYSQKLVLALLPQLMIAYFDYTGKEFTAEKGRLRLWACFRTWDKNKKKQRPNISLEHPDVFDHDLYPKMKELYQRCKQEKRGITNQDIEDLFR